jgi:hypothetical protein
MVSFTAAGRCDVGRGADAEPLGPHDVHEGRLAPVVELERSLTPRLHGLQEGLVQAKLGNPLLVLVRLRPQLLQ